MEGSLESLPFGDEEEEEDNFLYDSVFKYQPLLSKVLSFCHDSPKRPNPLLSLRLVSTLFNDALLNLKGCDQDKHHIFQLRILPNLSHTEDEVARTDGRLCRDVHVEFYQGACICDVACSCASSDIPGCFSTLVQGHGSNIRILHLDRVLDTELVVFLTLINQECTNLRRLLLTVRKNLHGLMDEWEGTFPDEQKHLEALQVRPMNFNSSAVVRRFVLTIMGRFVEKAPNLQQLDLQSEMAVTLDPKKMRGLRCLTLRNFRGDTEESARSLWDAINAVATTLEKLELHPKPRDCDDTLILIPQLQPVSIQPLPALKSARLGIGPEDSLGLPLWRLILEGGAGALETLHVTCSDKLLLGYFWTSIFSLVSSPLATLTTFKVEYGGYHTSSITDRLGRLHRKFPKLSRISFELFLPRRRSPARCFEETLHALGEWMTPLKEVQISLVGSCTINDIVVAFEAVGEGFFTSDLEAFSVMEWFDELNIGVTKRQFECLTRTLLWTRNMTKVAFYDFIFQPGVQERLNNFISDNELPIRFLPTRIFPDFLEA